MNIKNKEIIKAISTFETDLGMLRSVIASVRKSPLPEIRECLPALISAGARLHDVTFDKYFVDTVEGK